MQTQAKQILCNFLSVKDALGSSALHYACCMHNFDVVDFILDSLDTPSLTSPLDASQQSPYALLFWRIGRFVYSKEAKEKIKSYTLKHVLDTSLSASSIAITDKCQILDKVSKAYFPFVKSADFKSEESTACVFNDYPPQECNSSGKFASPLLFAINRQSFDMCKFLLKDLGFDVNTTDSHKITAMAYAIQVNNLSICKLLLNVDFEAAKTSAKKAVVTLNSKATNRMKVDTLSLFRQLFCHRFLKFCFVFMKKFPY